jgi:monofunctional glycosyltransferase
VHGRNGTGSGGGSLFGTILKWLIGAIVLAAVALIGLVIVYRFVTPSSTIMLGRYALHRKVEWTFVPLGHISPNLVAAVIASEDAHFCSHHGVDWGAMREVVGHADEKGMRRGASTVTMQMAKNIFLWPSHSYVRKALEIPIALGIDAVWPKRRILEVYLNVAEWGDGVFGIEAASEAYFHKHARDLDQNEAALLAAVLPNPHLRSPLHPSRRVAAHAKIVMARLVRAAPRLDCLH